jgi:hypothetical protein
MITLLIGAVLAIQPPSDALCAAAYALQTQRMQDTGELPSQYQAGQSLTPAQRTGVAAARHVIEDGVSWTALATRTAGGRKAVDSTFRALARSRREADAAFAACSKVEVRDLMPFIAEPLSPGAGGEGCADVVVEFYSALRACRSLEVLSALARETQSKLERGALTCRSKAQAGSAWAQVGSALAGADSQGQKLRCAVQ